MTRRDFGRRRSVWGRVRWLWYGWAFMRCARRDRARRWRDAWRLPGSLERGHHATRTYERASDQRREQTGEVYHAEPDESHFVRLITWKPNGVSTTPDI